MNTTPPLIHSVGRMLDHLRRLCLIVSGTALAVLIVSFAWMVFGRYVLNSTPTWVEQLALLLICYISFIGAAAGVQEDTHIGVTLFRDMLPPGAQKVLIVGIDFMLAGFGAVMLIAGITLMRFGWGTLLPMLNIPESFRTLAITSCGALVLLFAGTRGVLRLMTYGSWGVEPEMKEV